MESLAVCLNQDEEKTFLFLNELHETLKIKEIKSLDPLIKQFNINPNIGTTLFIDGIITKKRPYKWISSIPDGEMAKQIVFDSSIYLKINASKELFRNLFDDENEFPYPFKKVWTLLGYYDVHKAKRSLLDSCDEGKDFIIAKDGMKTIDFDQNGDDSDFLYLSRMGIRMFISCSQKPIAKYFSRVFFEIDDEKTKIIKSMNKGVAHQSDRSILLDCYEEAIVKAKKFQNNLADEVHRINKDPSQLLLPFDEDQLYKMVYESAEEFKRTVLKNFNNKPNAYLQLPQNSQKIGVA